MSNELYEGVKFQTVFLSHQIPTNVRLNELKKWYKIFYENNLIPVSEGISAGNLSFRIDKGKNEFIITGTQIGLKDSLSNELFVTVRNCDFLTNKIFVEGIKEPSSESFLHTAIYKSRPEINVIMHGHSQVILNNAIKFNIKQTNKEESYGSLNLVKSTLEILDKLYFFVIKNHGFVSLGKTTEEAGQNVLDILNRIKNGKLL